MKHLISFIFLLIVIKSQAQCGVSDFCNANTGIFSNNNATDIAYDNMGSGFHCTFIKDINSVFKIWGEGMANDGVSNIISPKNIDAANYPALTGTIYKVGIGSSGIFREQLIVLTSTGLFASGTEGIVLDDTITSSTVFQKIAVNGKSDGLPANISPADVKMLFVTSQTIIITTCTGEVFALALSTDVRGNGGTGLSTQWNQVMENATTPLTNVIVARGNYQTAFALKSDGTIWTWGTFVFLGDGTAVTNKSYATQMTIPAGSSGIKMIQATHYFTTSYYVLDSNKILYSLGENIFGELGDGTSTDRTVWVNAKNPDNSNLIDAEWISANEHDDWYDGIAVIKTGGKLYTAGSNSRYMVGRTVQGGINIFDLPAGILATDVITYAETGGHTCALIKQCTQKYGYVGHRINGSIGDGTNTNVSIQTYDFLTPPVVNVCGTVSFSTPSLTKTSPVCIGQNAVFRINSVNGNTINYNINGGLTQTVLIGSSNFATITINNVTANQTLTITQIVNTALVCPQPLSISETIVVNPFPVNPTFTAINPICEGEILNPLPLISNNGISGSWNPNLDNTATTTYYFTPSNGICANQTQMTIIVNPKVVPIFAPLAAVCYNQPSPVLPNISQNGISGTWNPNIVNNLISGGYQFTPNSNQCSLMPPPLYLTVENDFDFEIKHNCENNIYSLQIVPLNQSFNLNSANIVWINNATIAGSNNLFNVSNYLITNAIIPKFPLIFDATVTLPNGCFKTHSTSLFSTFCSIQKGISPNNDNENDFFDLRLMNVRQLKIYNRYGFVVYTKENYTDQWIGQNDENQELPSGTYYFVIDFNEDKPAAVGWIYINREH